MPKKSMRAPRRKPGRPRKSASKRKPGRPRKSASKRKPGRPRKSGRKSRKPGRPRKSAKKVRPQPPYPPSEYPSGAEIRGNDGYLWTVKIYKGGARRWVKLPEDEQIFYSGPWNKKYKA